MAGLHGDVIQDESCGIGGNDPTTGNKIPDDESSSDSIIFEEDWQGGERILREHRFKKMSSNENKQPGTSNTFEKHVVKVSTFGNNQPATANSFKKVASFDKKQLGTSSSLKTGPSLEKKQLGTSDSFRKVTSLIEWQPGPSNRVKYLVKKVACVKENQPRTTNSFKTLVEKDSCDKETKNIRMSDSSIFESSSRESAVMEIKKEKEIRQKRKYGTAECTEDKKAVLGNRSSGNSSLFSGMSTDEIEIIDVSDDEIPVISSKDNPKSVIEVQNDATGESSKAIKEIDVCDDEISIIPSKQNPKSVIEIPNDAAGESSKAVKKKRKSHYVKFKSKPPPVFKNNILLAVNSDKSSETKTRRRIIRYCDACRAKVRIILNRLKTEPPEDNEVDEDASLLSNIQLPTHSESKSSTDLKNSTDSPRNVSISKPSNELNNSTNLSPKPGCSKDRPTFLKPSNKLDNSTNLSPKPGCSKDRPTFLKPSNKLDNSTNLSPKPGCSKDTPTFLKPSNKLDNSTNLSPKPGCSKDRPTFLKPSNHLDNSTNLSPKPGCSKDRPTFLKPSNRLDNSTNLSPKPGCSKDRPTFLKPSNKLDNSTNFSPKPGCSKDSPTFLKPSNKLDNSTNSSPKPGCSKDRHTFLKPSNKLDNSTNLSPKPGCSKDRPTFLKPSNKLDNSTYLSPKPGCSKDRPTFSKPSNELNNSTNLSPKPGCSKVRPTENNTSNLSWEDINECEEIVESIVRESLESSQKPRKFSTEGYKESNIWYSNGISWRNSSDDKNLITTLSTLDEFFAESTKCGLTVGQEGSMIYEEENDSEIFRSDRNALRNCSPVKNASHKNASQDCSSNEKVSQNRRPVKSVSQNCSSDSNASQICSSLSDKTNNTLFHKEMSQENSQKSLESKTENCEAEQEFRSSYKTTNPQSSRVIYITASTQNENRIGFNTSTTHNKRPKTSYYARCRHENRIHNNAPTQHNNHAQRIYEKAQSFSSVYEEPNSCPPAKRKVATISSDENSPNLSKMRSVTVSNCSTSGSLRTMSKNFSVNANILSESENPPVDGGKKASESNNLALNTESVSISENVASTSNNVSANGSVASTSKIVSTNENVASTSNNVSANGSVASTSEIVPTNGSVASTSEIVSTNENVASNEDSANANPAPPFENVRDIRRFAHTYDLLFKNERKNATKCENELTSESLERLKLFAAERFLERVPKLTREKQTEVLDEILKRFPQHENRTYAYRSAVSARRYLVDEFRRVSAERIKLTPQTTSTSEEQSASETVEDDCWYPIETLDEMIPPEIRISRQNTVGDGGKTVSENSERSKPVTQKKRQKYKTLEDVLERYGAAFGDQEHFRFSYRMKKFLGLNPYGSPVLTRKKHATRRETEIESSSSNQQVDTKHSSNLSSQYSEPIRNLTTVQQAYDRSENRLNCNPPVENIQRNSETIRNTKGAQRTIAKSDDERSMKQDIIIVSDDDDDLCFPSKILFSNNTAQSSFETNTKEAADNSRKMKTLQKNVRIDNSKQEFHKKHNYSDSSTSRNNQQIQQKTKTTERENELSESGKYNLEIEEEIITISDDDVDDDNKNNSASNTSSNHNLTVDQRRFNTGLSSANNSQSNLYKNEIRGSNVKCTRTSQSKPSRNEITVNSGSHASRNKTLASNLPESDSEAANLPESDSEASNLPESDSEYLQYVHPSSQLNSSRRANDCASSKNKEFLQCVGTDKSLQQKIVGIKQVIDKDGWIQVDVKQVKPLRVKKCSCFYRDTNMMPYVDPEPCVNCILGVENRRTHEEYVNKFLSTNRPFVSMSLEEVSCSRNLDDWAHTNVKVMGQLRMRGMTETSHSGQPPYLCKEADHDFYLQSLDEPGGPFHVCIDFDRVKRAMPLAGKQIEVCAELCLVTSSSVVMTSSSGVEPFLKAMLYRDLDTVDRGTMKAYSRALDLKRGFVPLFLRADRLPAPVDDSCLDEEFDANKPRLV